MKEITDKYPNLFPEGKVTEELFYWSYEFAMTRGYGWSLPSTSMMPFADMFNHHNQCTTHYLVNKKYEADVKSKHE